jgi:hypothetical protein
MNAQTNSIIESRQVVPRVAKARSRLGRNHSGLLASLGFAALLSLVQSGAALAATAPPLVSTSTYGAVSTTFTNTAAGTFIIGTAGLPVWCHTNVPAVVPGFTGLEVVPCDPLTVGVDNVAAFANLNAQANAATCTPLGAAVDLAILNIGFGPGHYPPGCYTSTGAMDIGAGGVTLDGAGVYIFRPQGALNTVAGSSVNLNGACASDVFWGPTASTLGANTTFVGTLLQITDITIGNTVAMTGRALAFGHTITVSTGNATITVPTCAAFVGGGGGGTAVPTFSEWAMIMLAALLAIAGFAAMRRQAR